MQKQGLQESISEIMEVINHESRIQPDRIILAGISQGCATMIHVLFNSCQTFGGFVGLSGWIPFVNEIEDICRTQKEVTERLQRIRAIMGCETATSDNKACMKTPVFLGHCGDDEVVPYTNGEALNKVLRDLGMSVEWKFYDTGGHWLNEP